jgi:hypothetical protein
MLRLISGKWRSARLVVAALLAFTVVSCDAGLKPDRTPGQQFQPLQLDLAPVGVDFVAPAGGPNPGLQTVAVLNAGPGPVTGLGIGTILYEPVVGGWLTASLNGATFAPATAELSVDVAGLAPGIYFAMVPVVSTVTGVNERDIFVSLKVDPAPIIRVSPDTISINATIGGGSPTPQLASVTNIGTGNITGMSVGNILYDASASGWVNAILSQTTAPSVLNVQVNLGGLAAGVYTATVPVHSSVSGIVPDSTVVVLNLTATPASPQLSAVPTSIVMTANVGGASPAAATVDVTNSGGGSITNLALGTINYSPSGSTWLTASLNTTTAPAQLTLTPNTGSLPAGTYRARIPVSASGISGSPKIVTVDLTVNSTPALVLFPQTLNFTGTIGQPAPSAQQVTITNAGPGVLSGLAAGTITYGAGEPTGWLSMSLSSTTTPSSLVFSVHPSGLPAGTFNATVPVSSTTPGIPSKTISITLAMASQTGFFNIILGDQQSGLVDSLLRDSLVARVTDANFQPVAGVPVVWQVNNGGTLTQVTTTTSGLGEVTAKWRLGAIAGIQTVRVSSAGLPTLTFQADAQLPPSGSNEHPNEPAGFIRIAEHNMSSMPSYPRSLGGLAGSWYSYPQNDPDLVIINPDTTAPESPPNTIRTRFPQGLNGGSAPVNMGGWDVAGSGPAGQKSEVYISLWVKVLGPDYENHPVGTKMGFIAYGESPTLAQNQGVFRLKGSGGQSIMPSYRLEFHQQNHVARVLTQNGTQMPMTMGSWHHWEAYLKLNTLGQANGIFKWWMDGNLAFDYSDVVYINTGNTNKFHGWKWNPTWGGTGNVRTRDDFIALDHVYISGVP